MSKQREPNYAAALRVSGQPGLESSLLGSARQLLRLTQTQSQPPSPPHPSLLSKENICEKKIFFHIKSYIRIFFIHIFYDFPMVLIRKPHHSRSHHAQLSSDLFTLTAAAAGGGAPGQAALALNKSNRSENYSRLGWITGSLYRSSSSHNSHNDTTSVFIFNETNNDHIQ